MAGMSKFKLRDVPMRVVSFYAAGGDRRASTRRFFLSTLAAAGALWVIPSVEPFASAFQPLSSRLQSLSRGSKVPTVPKGGAAEEGYVEGPHFKNAPKSLATNPGTSEGINEGRKPRPPL